MSYSPQFAFLADLIYDKSRVNETAAQEGARYIDPTGAVWEIVAFREHASGYQGAVFKNTDTAEVVLVNRGTEIGILSPTLFT